MRSLTGLIRGIAALAVAILALIALSNFVPGFVGFVFGTVITLWVWPSALILLVLLNKGWRVSGKVGITGWGLRSRFAFLRTLRDIDLIATFYDRMVYGDKKHNAKLTARQRLQLEHFDGYLDDEELKEELSALAAKNKARKTTQAKPEPRPAPRQQRQVVREETDTTTSRTAPKANSLAQESRTAPRQPQTAPVEEHREVPVEDSRPADETVNLEEVAPAPEPRPAPRPAPRTSGSGVNNSSGFGGSIRITGDWGQHKG